ncbi:hypothetical protein [Flavobacterium sp. W20_MBD1_R3]|uniref:hypothetical protein n=1 Tax=Flavobacterium sp. W20_MBD1_R3 TaxID=3240278 RepID=UPI003F8DE8C8
MKRILFLMITISMSLSGYAQNEFSSKFKAIPLKNTAPKIKKPIPPKADVPPVKTPNVFKNPDVLSPKPNYSAPITPANNFSMTPKNEFINPGDVYKDKWNKKEERTEGLVYRKNQDLGNFSTGSVTAKVMYRDAAYVDGDQIRVYLNDKVIQYQVNLQSNFQGFEIVLEKGFNKIEFEALNQGSSGPNTAEFKVYNDQGGLISGSQWNLGTGFKATIILVKE